MRFVESRMDFIVKAYDVHAKRYILEHKTKAGLFDVLKTMMLWKDGNKQLTVWHIFKKYTALFSIYAYILQNAGKKTESSLALKGIQGVGKNRFTDVLCELMAGYSRKNCTNIKELTENFNSIVEGNVLIVANEMSNFGEDKQTNNEGLKSIETDYTIRINEKNQPRRDAENVANFIFVSNNPYPVKIEASDKRYVVLNYQKEFDMRQLPMTEAKRDIIKANKSQIEDIILKHLDEFKQGVPCANALQYKPENIKLQFYEIDIKTYCDMDRIQQQQ
ncbi:MAG: hypothetical protein EZS28_034507, partial [Streblomastix strix]